MKRISIALFLAFCFIGAACSRSTEEIVAASPTMTPKPDSATQERAITAAPKGPEPTKKEDSSLFSTPTPPLAVDELAVSTPPDPTPESKEEKMEQPPAQAGATEAPMQRAAPLRETSFEAPPAASPSPR